ncbi:MAG: tRNA (N(6)-L-threonylcarbamoyladenosine(37)-C(2))-methylthiotransferase MtaB [Clostridiales bacterium]|nr:tRNA (N(6)-L-threonylcarbamoyladenosine(37)-C(2))-methylthiotransferase MtaB [Clostridiales bacterium]
MKVYLQTLGCRVNQYETDAARELFIKSGYEITDSPEEADICVVNTCTVTGEADRKSRQQLRKMARLNPRAVVVAMGCMSEMAEGAVDADVVLGTKDKTSIVEKTESFLREKKELSHQASTVRPEVSKKDDYHEFGTVLSPEGTRAFMKIEDGCNKFCTYCIIPFARGRVASRDEDNIISEAEYLASEGFREVVVSGIHICSYGKDRGEGIEALSRVLTRIGQIEGIERIRIGSMEPMSLTPEFISDLSKISKLCPHFHLSLQSGSATVLKRMNRDYDPDQFIEKVEMLRSAFPTMSLTTDIICGFPGETDEEFSETLRFCDRAGFTKVHVFPYSLREGTVAAKMEQLPGGVGKARTKVLSDWSDRAEERFAEGFTGKETSVLIETYKDGIAEGYNPEYVRSFVKMDPDTFSKLQGTIAPVKVTGSSSRNIICDLI